MTDRNRLRLRVVVYRYLLVLPLHSVCLGILTIQSDGEFFMDSVIGSMWPIKRCGIL